MTTILSTDAAATTRQPRTNESKPILRWVGRVLSALPVLLLLMSSGMKLSHAASFVTTWTGKFGYPEGFLTGIGVLELLCVVVYLVPRTAVLGAILLTAYLGGAVASHVRIGDAFVIPVVLGVLLWAGLFLRDPRVRALLPLVSATRS